MPLKSEHTTKKSSSTSSRRSCKRFVSFPFYIASRYLVSKKSYNTINIISGISAAGVCIGTVALVCVLSVLNGFDALISDLFSAFDPDIKITLVQGKTFSTDLPELEQIKQLESVVAFTEVIEENALLRFGEKQMVATIKGVSDDFRQMTHIDSIMYNGKFELFDGAFYRSVPGIGVAASLGLNTRFIDPLEICTPKRSSRINMLRPENSLNREGTFVSGIFMVEQIAYDDNYVLVAVDLARSLFEYGENDVSVIEIKLANTADKAKVQKEIQSILGDGFQVKNRYEQQESFYKMMKIEKWVTYLILCFILFIACFNIISSLSMLIIDKKDDIKTLHNLGADKKLIKQIFWIEGWLISVVGALVGIVLGTIICLLQQYFGFLEMGGTGYVQPYPVVVAISDVLVIFATVLFMGFITSMYPVRYIKVKD